MRASFVCWECDKVWEEDFSNLEVVPQLGTCPKCGEKAGERIFPEDDPPEASRNQVDVG